MRTVTVTQRFAGSVPAAEAHWHDTSGWPEWLDECEAVDGVTGAWPELGSAVVWRSGPAGRGRVTERVVAYEPHQMLVTEVDDDSITGRQTVGFSPGAPGVAVELSLEYRIKKRSPITPVVDRLFIRGPMTDSLRRTLERFGAGLQ